MSTNTRKASPSRTRPLLDWEGAAEYLGTSVRHLKRIIYEPAPGYDPLPIVKVGGRVRLNPDQIDAWLAESQWIARRGE